MAVLSLELAQAGMAGGWRSGLVQVCRATLRRHAARCGAGARARSARGLRRQLAAAARRARDGKEHRAAAGLEPASGAAAALARRPDASASGAGATPWRRRRGGSDPRRGRARRGGRVGRGRRARRARRAPARRLAAAGRPRRRRRGTRRRVYVFGGGTAAGATDAIAERRPRASRTRSGGCRRRAPTVEAARLGDAIYVVGGYTGRDAAALACSRSGPADRVRARCHAAASAALRGRRRGRAARCSSPAAPTAPRARATSSSVDPATHRVRVIGRLPRPLAHAAGAALGGTFFVARRPRRRADTPARGDLGGRPAQRAALRPRRAASASRCRTSAAVTVGRAASSVAGGRDAQRRRGAARLLDARRPRPPSPRRARGRAAPGPHPGAARPPRRLRRRAARPARARRAPRPARASTCPTRVKHGRRDRPSAPAASSGTSRSARCRSTSRPRGTCARCGSPTTSGNSLTPIDPRTGRHGRPVPVLDPYNLYFTADGRRAIVVAEAHRELDFREPHTMRLRHALHVAAVPRRRPHGLHRRRALRARLVRVRRAHDRRRPRARARRPDDRAAAGRDAPGRQALARRAHLLRRRHGVQRRLADRRRSAGAGSASSPPAAAPTACTPAATRDVLYVSNRGEGTITLISFRTRRPVRKWRIPGGGSPDMGGVSADGRVLWLTGRYNAEVYAISTRTGRLLHRIRVGSGPARPVRLAPARPLLDRPHRHPALINAPA